MTSPRHKPGYLPVKIDNKTVLELKPERIAKLREKVLSGNYDDIKSQLPDLLLDDLQTRFARHENGILETTLLAAIGYCEERKQKNANEKMALELQERDLAAEANEITKRMEAAQTELNTLESRRMNCEEIMGKRYLEQKKKIEEALVDNACKSLPDGADSPFSLQKITDTGVAGMLHGLAKTDIPDTPPIAMPPRSLDATENLVEKAREKIIEMTKDAKGIAIDETVSLMRYFPDDRARREIRMSEEECIWLETLDIETASKTDPAVVKNAAKELRKMRMKLIETAKLLNNVSKTLNSQHLEIAGNCNFIENGLRAQNIKPEMVESAKNYIETMRSHLPGLKKAIGNLEKVQRINREMAELTHVYQKAHVEYPDACRKLIECRKRAAVPQEHASTMQKHRALIDDIKGKGIRMSELAILHRGLKDEYVKAEKRRWKKLMHVQNSPKEDARKTAEEKLAFAYMKERVPNVGETQLENGLEKELDRMAECALENYPDFKKRYTDQRENFKTTLKDLGRIYHSNGCKMGQQHIIGTPKFGKRAVHEPNRTMQDGAYKLVRVGIESNNKYRIIIDLADPERPAILFAGIKDNCDKFLDNRAYTRAKRLEPFDGLKNL